MEGKNLVFIATSLDGYIADRNGGLDFLSSIPNPDNLDFGYAEFIKDIDAIVMGRKTFEVVCNFDCPWPYQKSVFVMGNSLTEISEEYQDKVHLVKGELDLILKNIREKGYKNIYIDGGMAVQSFLKADLIDEMTISHIPVILGGGVPLFNELPKEINFTHIGTKIYLNELVQSTYKRK